MKAVVNFESCLKKQIDNYLILRESQGHHAEKERHIFVSLDIYLNVSKFKSHELTSDVIDGWLSSLPKKLNSNTKNIYITHYIQFAKYLLSLGYMAFIPEKSIIDRTYSPYIFHNDELIALVKAADEMFTLAPEKYHYNTACFAIMLRMLIGCGFRINEILLLKTEDVDLECGIVHVRNAKGNRDRLVPMHESLTEILRLYAGSCTPMAESWFFSPGNGKPFSYSWARENFNKCLGYIGIEKPYLPAHSRNICIHCLRHSYAVTALRKMDIKGSDLYSEIPILSTYLGHENIYGTEHYLHMTIENSSDILSKMEEFNRGLFPEVSE